MNLFEEKNLPILAGVAGAVASALVYDGAKTWRKFATLIVVGSLFAGFVMPGIAEYLGVSSIRLSMSLVFLGGCGGCMVVTAFVNFMTKHQDNFPRLVSFFFRTVGEGQKLMNKPEEPTAKVEEYKKPRSTKPTED